MKTQTAIELIKRMHKEDPIPEQKAIVLDPEGEKGDFIGTCIEGKPIVFDAFLIRKKSSRND